MTEFAHRISRGIFRLLLPLLAVGQASAELSMVDRSIPVDPDGAVADAGWALGRLNKGDSMTNASFVYPETTTPVRLYLIDTGVAPIASWSEANPNLKSFRSHLVRATGDPATSSVVAHGTQMLSLIVGPETGAAVGTPVHVVNYNIYPGTTASTTLGRLQDAIFEVLEDHEANPGLPSVLCIANSSSYQASSAFLESLIDDAVEAGITVVVSAGNEKASAASYIPAAYGSKDGVICVGASGTDNLPWVGAGGSGSNTGAAVDLYAPGQNVRTLNPADPRPGNFSSSNGTSPASALTAAAALIQLSLNPSFTPAQVEEALTATAYAPVAARGASATALVQVQPGPEADSDQDGSSDVLEKFFGSDPANPAVKPAPVLLSRVSGQARLSFNVAADLFNPADPHVLADGSTWKVRISDDLKEWSDAVGILAPGQTNGDQIPVTFSVPEAGPRVFLKIEVTPPPVQ
ncbi:S8 family serine peptidase [Luteolibacter flavescens]|uniref:S8 family serine peptidase n=1 Tax=Luteolibacter flavescens TaxID=1859460 RepID=A0ABT3FMT6_9BACT|nr:S8 family serine peptidase [Luteolibacter flavescens]MCW1884654.1 S8 family serine peptidase [Luteolibacter flavescens]